MEGGEVVLRTWDVESTHNYNNNMHVKQVINHQWFYTAINVMEC